MSFKIESAQQLQMLLSESGLTLDSIEQLQDLLTNLGQDPGQRKEDLAYKERLQQEERAHKERLQEREHAHAERLRNLDHVERMRALELGQPLPNVEEVELARSVVHAAAGIAIAISIVLALAATGLSAIILLFRNSPHEVSFFGVAADFQTTLFSVLWGVCGLLVFITVLACVRTARQGRSWNPPAKRRPPARQPAREDRPSLPVLAASRSDQ